MVAPTGFVDQAQLASAVQKAAHALGPEVVRVKHAIGADTSGDPAIFFRIVLAEWAVDEETLADVTGKIATTLFDEIRPCENWGLVPYFTFRSSSEENTDREWA
ncbi:MAG: hypothetical protein SGI92_13640 [Bryobacteraceae bacterium]|nr:hypothetical protein [Bryobacteraceae bacterium]